MLVCFVVMHFTAAIRALYTNPMRLLNPFLLILASLHCWLLSRYIVITETISVFFIILSLGLCFLRHVLHDFLDAAPSCAPGGLLLFSLSADHFAPML